MSVLIISLFVVLIILVCIATGVGSVNIKQETVWAVIFYKLSMSQSEPFWSTGRENIIWTVRLPRTLLAAMVGSSLAVVGASLQSVTRNSLADPHLLGVSSGAALGAVIALLHTGMIFGGVTVPIFSFVGALFATILVLSVANFSSAHNASRLVLAGVAVSFILSALGSLSIFMGDHRSSHTVIFWMLGGLGLAQWDHLWFPLFSLVLGSSYLIYQARYLNAMTLGDESAATLGVPVARFRLEVITVCALLTGAAVAFSGIIGFIGLMVPHAARFFVGGDHRKVLPLCALLGAIFLVAADVVSRVLIPPEDMPIGIITGLVGGSAFVLIMRKQQSMQR